MPDKTIRTVQGIADFVKTETEDKYGHWNDRYYTRDGYWVIHEGTNHHVYEARKKIKEVM